MNKPATHVQAAKYTAVLALALWAQIASAFTYGEGDLLLVFRADGFNDVEFNIGTVSNFLGKVGIVDPAIHISW